MEQAEKRKQQAHKDIEERLQRTSAVELEKLWRYWSKEGREKNRKERVAGGLDQERVRQLAHSLRRVGTTRGFDVKAAVAEASIKRNEKGPGARLKQLATRREELAMRATARQATGM